MGVLSGFVTKLVSAGVLRLGGPLGAPTAKPTGGISASSPSKVVGARQTSGGISKGTSKG